MRRLWVLLLGCLMILTLALPAAAAGVAPVPAPGPADLAGLAGVVTDRLGRPVAGAEVEVYHLGEGLKAVLTTDAHGGFRVKEATLGSGLWQFRTWAKYYRTAETGWIEIPRSRYQAIELEPLFGGTRLTVRDKDGGPVKANVLLVGAGGEVAGEWSWADQVQADFLTGGDYRAVVWAPEFVPVTRPLTVVPGQTASLLVTLDRAANTIAGEVLDAVTGQPIPGARLTLLRDDHAVVTEGEQVDEGGHFRLGVIQHVPETYQLRVLAKGYVPFSTKPFSAGGGQGADFSGAAAVRLQPASGVVAGVVLKTDSKPNAANVVLEVKGFGEVATQPVGETGTFRFDGWPADPTLQYRVRTDKFDEYGVTPWMTLSPGVSDQLVIQTRTGYSGDSVGYGSLSGVVVSAAGAPLKGAKVELYRQHHLIKTLETDALGAFTVTSLGATRTSFYASADPYTVRISLDGFIATGEVTVEGQSATTFHVTANQRTTLRATLLPARTTLRGRVVNTSGLPVAGAEVYLDNGLDPVAPMVRSDENGWYTLKDLPVVPLARYSLRAKAYGYRPVGGVEVTLKASSEQSLPTLKFVPAETAYTGQVLGPNGQALSGVSVTMPIAGGITIKGAPTGEAGVYRIPVPPMFRPVALVAGGDRWTKVAVELPDLPVPGATVSKDMVLLPSWTAVSGRVLREDGTPAAGVTVQLLGEGRGVVASMKTDGQGAYAMPMVTLGNTAWFWLRIDPAEATLAGSLRHGTELVPQLKLMPGQETVVDLLVK